jgi:hypothetical protein
MCKTPSGLTAGRKSRWYEVHALEHVNYLTSLCSLPEGQKAGRKCPESFQKGCRPCRTLPVSSNSGLLLLHTQPHLLQSLL